MRVLSLISYSLLAMISIAYFATAFVLMISEGSNQEPTIYNLIGIIMFAIPVSIYNLNKK